MYFSITQKLNFSLNWGDAKLLAFTKYVSGWAETEFANFLWEDMSNLINFSQIVRNLTAIFNKLDLSIHINPYIHIKGCLKWVHVVMKRRSCLKNWHWLTIHVHVATKKAGIKDASFHFLFFGCQKVVV